MTDTSYESVSPESRHIVLVDDHPLTRDGMRSVLEESPHFVVSGEAESVSEALALLDTVACDAMVVDLSLRDSSGLELLSEIPAVCPGLPVLVVSMKEESFYAERVLRAGARGFLSKDRASSELAQALETILDGGVYASAETSTRIIGAAVRGGQTARSLLESLTNREFTVLEMIGSGLPPRKIAEKLHISPKTVDSHREHIKTKLNLPDAAALTRFAIEWARGEQGAAGEA